MLPESGVGNLQDKVTETEEYSLKLSEKKAEIAATPARKRLTALFDEGSFTELDAFARHGGDSVEVVCGFGTVDGSPVYAFSQDGTVKGGAIGRAQALKIKKVYDLAVKTGAPVVGIYDSNGLYLGDGVESLAACSDMLRLSDDVSGVVPRVSVIAGPCGGTLAMIAEGADIVIMSEKAEFFMTAPDVVRAQDQDAVPGTAAACAESGLTHLTAEDDMDAVAKARLVLSRLPLNNLSTAPIAEFAAPAVSPAAGEPAAKAIAGIAGDASVIELQPSFGKNAVTALATVNGSSVGFVAYDGAVDSDACIKAARFVSMCDAFSIPVVTLVNSTGYENTPCAEKGGMLRRAAQLSHVYAQATTPMVSVITGDAYGAVYMTLAGRAANADLVYAWEGAAISALAPEAAVSILWNERLASGEKREALAAEYRDTAASPFEAAANGALDGVIEPAETRAAVIAALDTLCGKRVPTLARKHTNMPL